MATSDSSKMATPLDELLVAYLDGELDPEASRQIEERLAVEPEVRRRLQEMERTWEMLDQLDEAPAGAQFTHTTLEMVAVAARKDVEEGLAEAPRRRRRRFWIIGGGLLAALLAGFLVVAVRGYEANQQLLRDLPLLENLDEYRQIDSMEFLRLLDKEKLPLGQTDDTAHEAAPKPEIPLAERRAHIENMSPSDKEELARAEEQFAGFDRDYQERLRVLHAAIESAPDAERLRHTMQHYGDWTNRLTSYSRAELRGESPAERIEWIKKRLQTEPALDSSRRINSKDVEAIWKWMNECAAKHEAQYLATFPEEGRTRLANLEPATRHFVFIRAMWPPAQPAASAKPALVTDDDLTHLLPEVSREMRSRLESPERWRVLSMSVREAMRRQMTGRSMRGPLTDADDERLADFFENLPELERDRLLNLPGEEMQRQLLQLYLNLRPARFPDGGGNRPDGQKGRRFGGQGSKRPPADKSSKEPPPTAP